MSAKMKHLLWTLMLAMVMALPACRGAVEEPTVAGQEPAPLAALQEEAAEVAVEEAPAEVAVVEEVVEVAVEEPFDVAAAVNDYLTSIPEGYMVVKLDAFKEILDTGEAVVIDLREPGEYAEGHVPGAVNIPLRTLGANLDLVPADKPVIVYCASGHRAAMGTSSLRVLGYENVRDFAPGFKGWAAAEEPVSTDAVTGETYAMPEIDPALLAAVDNFLATIPDGWLTVKTVENLDEMVANGAMVVDVRQADEFAAGAIEGAVNIPIRDLGSQLADLPQDQMVVVYCASGHRAALSTAALQIAGLNNVRAFPGGYPAWQTAMAATAEPDMVTLVGNYLNTMPEGFLALKVDSLKEMMEAVDPLLIDVRETSEYAEGHIEGAINIPIRTLAQNLDLIPMDRPVVVYCGSGHRAAMATTSLQVMGFQNVRSFAPSIKGWVAAEEPLTTEVFEAEVLGMPDVDAAVVAKVDEFLSTIPDGWLTVKSAEDLTAIMDVGGMVVDVREVAEYETGHIDGAINMPLRDLPTFLSELPTDVPVVVYCASGHRAALTLAALQEMGFQNVRAFPAGFAGWQAAMASG